MKKQLLTLTLCLSILAPLTSLSWGYRGHILIAQIAYNNFSANDKNQADHYAKLIIAKLPRYMQKRFNNNYPSASDFARVAALPDSWRKRSLQTIFHRFGATLPKILKPYADEVTDSWHFINQSYGNTQCNLIHKKNVVWAINILKKAWDNTNNPNSKAVIMVFLEHFIGDAHQPLHTFSKVGENCQGDLGGNKHTVMSGGNPTNLHRLWDRGVGLLTRNMNMYNKSIKLQKSYPEATFNHIVNDLNPQDWVKHDLKFARFIYSIKAYNRISPTYYRTGQDIARRQITLAGYRLEKILTQLFNQQQ